MPRKQTAHRFVLCVKNDDYDDLEKRKVYRVIVGRADYPQGTCLWFLGKECEVLTRDWILAVIGRAAFQNYSFHAISGNRNGL